MKLHFMRTKSAVNELLYSGDDCGNVKYNAEIPLNFTDVTATFYHDGKVKYKLCFDSDERIKNMFKLNSTFVSNPFNILDCNGGKVGHIFGKQTKSFWRGGYFFYEYNFCGCNYFAYSIGMGKEGIKIPIYNADCQVALIEKGVVVHDNKDSYYIYVPSETELEIATLFNLYYDFVKFGNRQKLVYKTKKVEYFHSPKALKSKFDPDFKLMCEKN
ncbi:MAG: hypothetical protein FWH20_06995 [Oscillospiraceae bacterium]|nr:hypothetical protein [Oscillospiraceae bacterium]